MNATSNTTTINYAAELAYGIMIAVAFRIAQQDAQGDTESAANDYLQHCTTLTPEAKAEFDSAIASAAAQLQERR